MSTTWIVFTVRALVCTPSPPVICSFRITGAAGIGIVVSVRAPRRPAGSR